MNGLLEDIGEKANFKNRRGSFLRRLWMEGVWRKGGNKFYVAERFISKNTRIMYKMGSRDFN